MLVVPSRPFVIYRHLVYLIPDPSHSFSFFPLYIIYDHHVYLVIDPSHSFDFFPLLIYFSISTRFFYP